MKKFLVLFLAGLMVIAFIGCGAEKEEPDAKPDTDQEQSVEEPKEEPTEETALDGVTTPEKAADGTYTAEGEVDDHGWAAFVTLEIAGGKITTADFDYKNGDVLKSEDEEYNTSMESAVGTKPETYLPEYEAALVESQDVTEVDSISGATQSYSEFVKLAQEALGKAVEK